ncbi:Thioredoxin domain-containing protein 12 [Mactra antiquata]
MDVFTIFLFVGVFCIIGATKDLSNGWNPYINWKTLEEAEKESEETNKPIMLVIHKSWCGACRALQPQFAASVKIERLSSNFLMVNTLDDDEPKGEKYLPDGGYIPRILFIHKGEVREDLYNEAGNPKYKYYYYAPNDILTTMEKAIKTFNLGDEENNEDRVVDEL